jgi:hypothetical protein
VSSRNGGLPHIFPLYVLCSDNIDFDTGELDDEVDIVKFDDKDLFGKALRIANALTALEEEGNFENETKCTALLSEFHRVEELDAGFKWVGGIVTEICLASGTTEASVVYAEVFQVES